jgi:predicted short-subunit dehydrogenase-like oxidoreductase (DUF2520 family)
MSNDDSPAVGIVGPGRLGLALAIRTGQVGGNLRLLLGRSPASARRAVQEFLPEMAPSTDPAELGRCRLVLLTVRDDQIQPLASHLAAGGLLSPHAVVAHCSGALTTQALAPLADIGLATASMHPLQTFPNPRQGAQKIPGSYFFCETPPQARECIENYVKRLGARFRTIESAAKPLYHASAVMACNYLTALIDAATRLAGAAGIDTQDALDALGPLTRATLENILSLGPAKALTGPIARGDHKTVAGHLRAIADSADALGTDTAQLYRLLGRTALELARPHLEPETIQTLQTLLKSQPTEGKTT